MKVTILEKDFEYVSDYPEGWLFSSGDSFKFPITIGKYICFIKRFENKKPESISGWEVLNKLKGRFETSLPKIYDIVYVEESSKNVYYIFLEYLKGNSLDILVSRNSDINLLRLTNDIFNALKSLHKIGYWFADFTEKNIYCEESGRFFLIDIDSAQSVLKPPHNDMYGDKEYWALVFTFYQDILNYKDLKPSDIDGALLNYLQVIFLILRLKISLKDQKYEYKSEGLYNALPLFLNSIDIDFKNIFNKVLEADSANYLLLGDEIKNLISLKIIQNSFKYSAVVDYPLIKFFKSDKQIVIEGSVLSLSWEVENALEVEVQRNGVLYKKVNSGENVIRINEFYDGQKKKVLYTILVSNKSGVIKSKPISVFVTDSEQQNVSTANFELPAGDGKSSEDKIGKEQENRTETDKRSRWIKLPILIAAAIIAVFVAAVIMFTVKPQKKVIISLIKNEVTEGNILIIFGNNFPEDSSHVKVYFNMEEAHVSRYFQNNIRVIVPKISKSNDNSRVKVAVVIKGDTTYAPTTVSIKESHTTDSISLTQTQTQNPATNEFSPSIKNISKEKNLNDKKLTEKDKNKMRDDINNRSEEAKKSSIYDFLKAVSAEGSNKVTVYNGSKYDIDVINVAVSYLNNEGAELSKEIISFRNVNAHSKAMVSVRNPNNKERVDPKIISIRSAQLEKDIKQDANNKVTY